MTARRRTFILILMLMASSIGCAMAWSALNASRGAALSTQNDLAACQRELAVMNVKASNDTGSFTDTDQPINRELREAAISAHLPDQLASIDPGTTARVADSDYTQTPLFVRLNAVTLRQLVDFLHELSAIDSSLRSTDIELSPALAPSPNRLTPGEGWTADLTISHLAYGPQARSAR